MFSRKLTESCPSDTRTWRVLSVGDALGPAPRWGHSSVVVNHTLYIYGGRDNVLQFSDMYAFDLKTKKWTVIASSPNNAAAPGSSMSVSAPQHRYFHGAAVHANSIYFVWGKNIYDFCFADILQYVIGAPGHPLVRRQLAHVLLLLQIHLEAILPLLQPQAQRPWLVLHCHLLSAARKFG